MDQGKNKKKQYDVLQHDNSTIVPLSQVFTILVLFT